MSTPTMTREPNISRLCHRPRWNRRALGLSQTPSWTGVVVEICRLTPSQIVERAWNTGRYYDHSEVIRAVRLFDGTWFLPDYQELRAAGTLVARWQLAAMRGKKVDQSFIDSLRLKR